MLYLFGIISTCTVQITPYRLAQFAKVKWYPGFTLQFIGILLHVYRTPMISWPPIYCLMVKGQLDKYKFYPTLYVERTPIYV